MRTATGLVVQWLAGVALIGCAADVWAVRMCSFANLPVQFTVGYSALDHTVGQSTLRVSCTGSAADLDAVPAVAVLISRGSAPTFTPRQMTGPGGAKLSYNLFGPQGPPTPWGDGTGAPSISPLLMPTGNGSERAADMRLNLVIPAGQWAVPPGVYSETLEVTIFY
jgi:spore coat protein U-like protein